MARQVGRPSSSLRITRVSSTRSVRVEMYELHNLGWSDFQKLCLTITREILGQTVESFLDTGDGGRDGAFTGTWKTNGQEDLSGPFVIQCKSTSRINYSLKLSDLKDEVQKAKKLVAQGLCESYVLITSAGLTGPNAARIKARLKAVGVKHVRTFGSTWIRATTHTAAHRRRAALFIYDAHLVPC